MAKVRNIFSLLALSKHLTKACLKQEVCYDNDKKGYTPDHQLYLF